MKQRNANNKENEVKKTDLKNDEKKSEGKR